MADTTPSQPDGIFRPARQYRPSRGRRVGDAIISVFIRAGLVPSSYLLTTRGRKTGRPRTNPVTVVEHDGKRWLVAPYGPVSWVHNARAAGRVTLRRRLDARAYAIREASAQEAGPVLKRYVRIASATRPYFQAAKDSPVEDFVAEADRHPVFELTPSPVIATTTTVNTEGRERLMLRLEPERGGASRDRKEALHRPQQLSYVVGLVLAVSMRES
jgi:deazaflavin-dependent oxidoreductase (nitroreductase family)